MAFISCFGMSSSNFSSSLVLYLKLITALYLVPYTLLTILPFKLYLASSFFVSVYEPDKL